MAEEVEPERSERRKRREPAFESIEALADGAKSWEGVAYFGLLTFVATMAYEFGFATYWHIPYALLSFTPENAFRTAIVLILSAFATFVGCSPLAEKGEYKFKKVIRFLLILLGIGALLVVVRVMPMFQALVAIAGIYFISVATKFLLFPGSNGTPEDWAHRIKRHMGLAMVTLLLAMPYFAAITGYVVSEMTREYLVLDGQPRQVVLRVYGSNALCAEYSEAGEVRELLPGFRIVNLADTDAPRILRVELKGLLPAER